MTSIKRNRSKRTTRRNFQSNRRSAEVDIILNVVKKKVDDEEYDREEIRSMKKRQEVKELTVCMTQ